LFIIIFLGDKMAEYELMKYFNDEYHKEKEDKIKRYLSELRQKGFSIQEIEYKKRKFEEEYKDLDRELERLGYEPDTLITDLYTLVSIIDNHKDVIGIYGIDNETGEYDELSPKDFLKQIDPAWEIKFLEEYLQDEVGSKVVVTYADADVQPYKDFEEVADIIPEIDPNRIIGAVRVKAYVIGKGKPKGFEEAEEFEESTDFTYIIFRKTPDEALADYLYDKFYEY
jgi:hypothetical protein